MNDDGAYILVDVYKHQKKYPEEESLVYMAYMT